MLIVKHESCSNRFVKEDILGNLCEEEPSGKFNPHCRGLRNTFTECVLSQLKGFPSGPAVDEPTPVS